MQYIVILVCLLVTAYGALSPELVEEIKIKVLRVAGECKEKVSASDDDIDMIENRQVPSTRTGKCFLACLNKSFGFQDASGKPDKFAALSMVEKIKPSDEAIGEKMIKVIEICFAEVNDGGDECETAASLATCSIREDKAAGLDEIDF